MTQETIGALIIAIVAVMFAISTIHRMYDDRNRYKEQIKFSTKIYDVLSSAVERPFIHRVLIMKSENGGGVPSAGSQLYTSVIYEEFRAPAKSVKREYQRIMMDAAHHRLLNKVIKDGYADVMLDEMEPGLLKMIYASEGVYCSRLFFIKATRSALFYGSISTTDEVNLSRLPETVVAMEITIAAIRENFKKIT